jgi:catechol 2,3-dioxygenase-like lactoylglutathione lyase family enzyme
VTPRTRLTGLHHVGLHTADPEGLLAFYRDMFEVELHALSEPSIRACAWFAVGDDIVEVIPAQQPGPDHLAFTVAERRDLTDLRARLLAAGHAVGEIRDLESVHCVTFHDPDGRRGEIVWAVDPAHPIGS